MADGTCANGFLKHGDAEERILLGKPANVEQTLAAIEAREMADQ